MRDEPPPDARLAASRVFTPAVPVSEADLFAGRMHQIQRVVDVINERGQHAVIFGERGVGKTSLANIIATRLAAGTAVVAPRINCDSTDDFSGIWRKVLAQIEVTHSHRAPGFRSDTTTAALPAAATLSDNVTPDEVRRVLKALAETQLVVVILDEFDRLENRAARRAVADTIKTLADHDVPATIVVVGVADTVDEFIAEHRSIERALVQIPMRRMTSVELEGILAKGAARLTMAIERAASAQIAQISQGLPHFTHLLGLHAVRSAIDDESQVVGTSHVRHAIARAVADSAQSLVSGLDRVGARRKPDGLADRVLLACALASAAGAGSFTAKDVENALGRISDGVVEGRAWMRHLDDLASASAGAVLVKTGAPRQARFAFAQALLQPVILMRGLIEGELSESAMPDWLGTQPTTRPPA